MYRSARLSRRLGKRHISGTGRTNGSGKAKAMMLHVKYLHVPATNNGWMKSFRQVTRSPIYKKGKERQKAERTTVNRNTLKCLTSLCHSSLKTMQNVLGGR